MGFFFHDRLTTGCAGVGTYGRTNGRANKKFSKLDNLLTILLSYCEALTVFHLCVLRQSFLDTIAT